MKIKNITLMCICLFIIALCTSACGGGKTNTQTQFVPIDHPVPVPVEEPHALVLSKTDFTVNIGATDNITVTLNNEDVTENASYTPDDESIATVEKGVITGLKQGTTRVNVHFIGAETDKTFTVNVIDKKMPNLELSQNTFALKSGETANIKVTLEGEDVTESVVYTPENKNIASADKGTINAQFQEGQTDITVSLEGANDATFTVNVKDDSDEEVELNEPVMNKLYELGLIDKDYEHRTELTEINIPGVYTADGKKYKIIGIADYLFYYCENLKSVTIPNSVTTIGEYAFESCLVLQSINIPDSVTTIGDEAFCYCYGLTTATLGNSVTTIGSYAFYDSSLQSINIPDSVTTIGNGAFEYCYGLTTVTLGNSVTTIGSYAFEYCYVLQSINIPDSVTTIGSYAFEYCYVLQSINIPDSVTTIGNGAFEYCYVLQSINIPDSVTTIGSYAFAYCYSLESITISESVTIIESYAFYNCISLTVTIPESVTSIGSAAFYDVKNIILTDAQKTLSGYPWGAKKVNGETP